MDVVIDITRDINIDVEKDVLVGVVSLHTNL